MSNDKPELTDEEWVRELDLLDIHACGFWKLDQFEKENFIAYIRELHEKYLKEA